MTSADNIKETLLAHPLVSNVHIVNNNGTWKVRCVTNKDNQKKIEEQQTQAWGRVWGDAYQRGNNTGNKSKQFDFSGYCDSFTEEEYTIEEMEAWFGSTMDSIAHIHPKGGRLLELGSGTGMVVHGVRRICGEIVASDVSEYAVEKLKSDVKKNNWKNVKIIQGDAHKVLEKVEGKFDTIVLNTIVQYFPSLNYLEEVLTKAKELLSDPGNIYIGDIRHSELISNFQFTLVTSRPEAFPNMESIQSQVNIEVAKEREMLYHPNWFHDWVHKNGGEYALTELRPGEKAPIEMKMYRFNTVLNFSTEKGQDIVFEIYDNIQNMQEIETILKENKSYLQIANLSNARLVTLLEKERKVITGEVSDKIIDSFVPDEIIEMAKNHNYDCYLPWGSPEIFSAVFVKTSQINKKTNLLNTLSKAVTSPSPKHIHQFPAWSRVKTSIEKFLNQNFNEEVFEVFIHRR